MGDRVGQAELLARREAAVSTSIAHSTGLFVSRADNAEIWDTDGKRYIDFAAGIAVLNTGHRHPRVVEAVRQQLDRFTHTCFQVTLYESYVALAERLNGLAPISGKVKSAFFTTGAEATENAVKIAFAATGRKGVLAFSGGFHGRTMVAMNMTGKTAPYKKRVSPVLPNIWHAAFPAAELGVTVEDSLRHIELLFKADIDPSELAAIIVEPIQGEGGFYPAPVEFMSRLRQLCDEHGIILIADEVQTGFGRTGKMFAMEHYPVEPDLICVAKGIAGGIPLSGVIGRAQLMDAAPPGSVGGTYAGNPLACAAALAVLDVIEGEGLLERANVIGQHIRSRFDAFQRGNNAAGTGPLRGVGAMIAFDVLGKAGSPDPIRTRKIIARAEERGLVVLSCGVTGGTIRLLVPLTIPNALLEEGLELLEAAIRDVGPT
jgi:4-aminobutyrate aminotransferase / (S)-3-amino-2-methylpropionate transaminase / 5-aminovalerate transaminase